MENPKIIQYVFYFEFSVAIDESPNIQKHLEAFKSLVYNVDDYRDLPPNFSLFTGSINEPVEPSIEEAAQSILDLEELVDFYVMPGELAE
ncbi:MAG: hypothetical protein AAGH79_14885, partial [Bacteroidota bacterium]